MKKSYLKKFKRAILRNTQWIDSTIVRGEKVRFGVAGEYTVELTATHLIIRGANDYYKFKI